MHCAVVAGFKTIPEYQLSVEPAVKPALVTLSKLTRWAPTGTQSVVVAKAPSLRMAGAGFASLRRPPQESKVAAPLAGMANMGAARTPHFRKMHSDFF